MDTVHSKGKYVVPTKEDALKKRDFLTNQLNLPRLKVSKVIDSMIQRSQMYMEHDPMLTQPEPSIPWVTDDLSYWISTDNPGQHEVVSEKRLRKWGISMHDLLCDRRGFEEMKNFLELEYSSENIEFLVAAWAIKKLPMSSVATAAGDIFRKFLQPGSEMEINIDSKTMMLTLERETSPDRYMFEEAEEHIYSLMERDSYPRFLKSEQYKNLLVLANTKNNHKKISRKFSFGFKKRVSSQSQKMLANEAADQKHQQIVADTSRDDAASSISSSSSTAVATIPDDSSCSGDSSDYNCCCSRASGSQEWLNGRPQMSYSTGNLKDAVDAGVGKKGETNFMGRFSPLRLKKKLKKLVRSVSPLPQQSNLVVPRQHHHHLHHKFSHRPDCHTVDKESSVSSTDLRKAKENIRTVVSVPGNLCNAAVLEQS